MNDLGNSPIEDGIHGPTCRPYKMPEMGMKGRCLMATVKHYGPGEQCWTMQPGDFILTHETDFSARLVQWGQALRFRGERRKYAYWNHTALFIGRGQIIEALGDGVHINPLSKYQPQEYYAVHIRASEADRQKAVEFALSQRRDRYGWFTIVSLALMLLTGTRLYFGIDGQVICSGLVAGALERCGVVFPRGADHVMPADLAQMYQVGRGAQEPKQGQAAGLEKTALDTEAAS